MFQKARFKLTAWYLLIIIVISLIFSGFVYNGWVHELERFNRFSHLRENTQNQNSRSQAHQLLDISSIEESRNRLLTTLALINFSILGLSAVAAYFLAGRTLKPIKQMLDEQNRFITDASHELRTPLTSLITSIEVNLRNKKLSLQNAKDLLENNLTQAYNLRTLSDDLLALNQYQGKNENLTFAQISLAVIVDEAIKRVNPLAIKKQIKIIDDSKDFSFEGDKRSLVDLLAILLDNAIKYSPAKSTIKIFSATLDHSISITVLDHGIGISNEDMPYIFDRFYRADKSRSKTEIFGYGLGLSIAQKIIDAHKGEIKIQSKINKGTQITVEIPKSQL